MLGAAGVPVGFLLRNGCGVIAASPDTFAETVARIDEAALAPPAITYRFG